MLVSNALRTPVSSYWLDSEKEALGKCILLLFLLVFVARSYCVAQAGLEFIHLMLALNSWQSASLKPHPQHWSKYAQ